MKKMTIVTIGDDVEACSVDVVLTANHFTDIDLIMAIREATAEFVQTEEGMKYVAMTGGFSTIFEVIDQIPDRISLKHGWAYWETVDPGSVVTVDMDISMLPDDSEILGIASNGNLIVWDSEECAPCVSDETLESFVGDDGLANLSDIEVDRLMRRYPTSMENMLRGDTCNDSDDANS